MHEHDLVRAVQQPGCLFKVGQHRSRQTSQLGIIVFWNGHLGTQDRGGRS